MQFLNIISVRLSHDENHAEVDGTIYEFKEAKLPGYEHSCTKCALLGKKGCEHVPCTPKKRKDSRNGYYVIDRP